MASSHGPRKSDGDTQSTSNESYETRVAPHEDVPPKSNEESRDTNHESVATAAHQQPAVDEIDPINKIETANSNLDNRRPSIANANRKVNARNPHRRGSVQIASDGAITHRKPPRRNVPRKASMGKIEKDPESQKDDEDASSSFLQNIWVMCSTFPYWNMAFWSGWCYSIGSALFVIDGAWAWAPVAFPYTEFSGEETYGVPLLFFFGACLYQVGGVMAYLEAVNDGCFAGSAMKRLLKGHADLEKELLDAKLHVFFGHLVPHRHHSNAKEVDEEPVDPEAGWKTISRGETNHEAVYEEAKEKVERRGGVDEGGEEKGQMTGYMKWQWYPTWHALVTYHIYELGYVACAIQLFGVTLYGITSVVILPGIFDSLSWGQELGVYWILQIIASCCFLTASVMFTIMAQERWHQPKWGAVSWWIGVWAIVGSVGFLLDAIFGVIGHTKSWASYQASLSSTWGSFFYMASGLFQWYEAINVNVGPVLAFPNQRTPVLLRSH